MKFQGFPSYDQQQKYDGLLFSAESGQRVIPPWVEGMAFAESNQRHGASPPNSVFLNG